MSINPEFKPLTVDQVAEIFGRDRTTIDRWCRDRPEFPKKRQMPIIGTRFLACEIEEFIARCPSQK